MWASAKQEMNALKEKNAIQEKLINRLKWALKSAYDCSGERNHLTKPVLDEMKVVLDDVFPVIKTKT